MKTIKMKTCIKCGKEKELTEFYKHPKMPDGRVNKCKECSRAEAMEREAELRKDPAWVEKEKKRHRDKSKTAKKQIVSTDARRKYSADYAAKFPERIQARYVSQGLKPRIQGNQLHHWSYNECDYKDVIELSISDHKKLHRYMAYDQEQMKYRTLLGVLLDTKERHLEYYESIKNLD